MNKEKSSVYIKDWMRFHPKASQTIIESYYLGLSKELYVILQKSEYEDLLGDMDKDDLKSLACYLTCYFEDVISNLGIWKAFTAAHFELYGKYLPFYNLDDYYDDEINQQDTWFLIWYFISKYFVSDYLSPTYIDIQNLGNEIYEIFDREYEIAPENTKFKAFLSIAENESDYYKIRDLADWLFINFYLFHFNEFDFNVEMLEIMDSEDKDIASNALALGQDLRDLMAISKTSNLLAFRGNHWLARVLGKDHALYNEIINLDKRKTGYFLFKGEDASNIILLHFASDKEILVTKKSFEVLPEHEIGKTIFLINLIKWKDEWWFSGSYSALSYNDEIVKGEKESAESKMLFENESNIDNTLESQYAFFLKYNNNKPIAFFENGEKIREFVNKYINLYNSSIKQSGETGIDAEPNNEKFHEDVENLNGIVYFEKNRGLSILMGLADVVPDNDNITYNPESEGDIMDFMILPNHRPDLVKYLVSNYPSLIDKYQEKTGEYFLQDNIDFLLRFWKHESFNN